jgi:hypothetical protein
MAPKNARVVDEWPAADVVDVGDCMFARESNGWFELLVDGGYPNAGGDG